jgi:AhpC/TSA family/Thiol:disulfide interchange protein DsbD, N-terminal
VLREFAEKQHIPYPLLSDIDSRVIRAYGILNDRIEESDFFLWGIPYPGAYVTDENGVVTAKFFRDTYKKRDSPEALLDAALGRTVLRDDTPRVATGDREVRITAAVHGGKGTIRQGILRKLVVRFELGPGLHLYGQPVPAGMVPTTVTVEGPPGLVLESPIFPPTTPLRLASLGLELPVWAETFDVVVPFHAVGELASETRPLDEDSATIEVTVRYQACDREQCLLPRTEKLHLEVPLDVVDVPALSLHKGHGQREGNFDATPHMLRLVLRSLRRNPLGLFRFIAKSLRLELAARRRRRAGPRSTHS